MYKKKKIAYVGNLIWLTGLSGAGKTSIAKGFCEIHPDFISLDGDEFRQVISNDLGFTREDRLENLKRLAGVCKLLINQGKNVITSFISPIESYREKVRTDLGAKIIYVKASYEVCEKRDPKGLYQRVKNENIKNFTGKDSIFEVPENPELIIETDKIKLNESVSNLSEYYKLIR